MAICRRRRLLCTITTCSPLPLHNQPTTTTLAHSDLVHVLVLLIAGNVFVIAAIILERNLQNVANYLVASLAVADLFVACLVMPLGAVYEVRMN